MRCCWCRRAFRTRSRRWARRSPRRSCGCCSRSAASSSRCSSSSTAIAPDARRRCARSACVPRRACGGARPFCRKGSIPTATRASTALRRRWRCSMRRRRWSTSTSTRMLPPGATLPQRTRVADDVKRLLARVSNDVQFELLARQAAARLGRQRGDLPPRARGGGAGARGPSGRCSGGAARVAGRGTTARRADGDRPGVGTSDRGGRGAGRISPRRSCRCRRAHVAAWQRGAAGRRGDRQARGGRWRRC